MGDSNCPNCHPDYSRMVPSEEALMLAIDFMRTWLGTHPEGEFEEIERAVETLWGMVEQRGAFPDAGPNVEKLTDAIDVYMFG